MVICTLDATATVYMDGSMLYNIRIKGVPGIRGTLRLWPDDALKLVQMGFFDWHE